MTTTNKRNYTLDIIKLIASFAVVFIHYRLPGNIGKYTNALARFAVPVFFISAGYFCYGNNSEKIVKKLKHILCIFAVAFLLYFAVGCASNIFEQRSIKGSVEYIKYFLDKKVVLEFLAYNYVILKGGHLWFLPALIYCYVIQFFAVKLKLSNRVLVVSATALIFFNLFAGEFGNYTGLATDYYKIRNFLFFGYPLFVYGSLIKKHSQTLLKHFSFGKIIIFMAVGTVETLVSAYYSGLFDFYIGSAIIAFSLFMFALKNQNLKYNKNVIAVAECSTEIYILHIMIESSTFKLLRILGVNTEVPIIYALKPFYVCIASVIIALIWKKIKQKLVLCARRKLKFENEG